MDADCHSDSSFEYIDVCSDSGVLDLSKNGPASGSNDTDNVGNQPSVSSPIAYDQHYHHENPRNTSPNYAACYPEHLQQYVLQAALHQQILMQKTEFIKPIVENNDVPEVFSEVPPNPPIPICPLISPGRDGKITRPFKAYPKDPLSLTAGLESFIDTESNEKFAAFRKKMIEQICASNGGQATVSNPKMRRTVNTNNNNNNNNDCCASGDENKEKSDQQSKDDSYAERRKKNNAAAKKSRDRRRIKEDEIAIRAAFLERENIELRYELAAARKRIQELCQHINGSHNLLNKLNF